MTACANRRGARWVRAVRALPPWRLRQPGRQSATEARGRVIGHTGQPDVLSDFQEMHKRFWSVPHRQQRIGDRLAYPDAAGEGFVQKLVGVMLLWSSPMRFQKAWVTALGGPELGLGESGLLFRGGISTAVDRPSAHPRARPEPPAGESFLALWR